MSAQTLLDDLAAIGVSIRVDAGILKVKGEPGAVENAVAKIRPYKVELLEFLVTAANDTPEKIPDVVIVRLPAPDEVTLDQLAPFGLDVDWNAADDGFPADWPSRINNLAYRLVTRKGYSLAEAFRVSAEWVTSNPKHADEKTFVDVQALFERLKNGK